MNEVNQTLNEESSATTAEHADATLRAMQDDIRNSLDIRDPSKTDRDGEAEGADEREASRTERPAKQQQGKAASKTKEKDADEEWSAGLLKQAEELGYTQDEIREECETPDDARRFLTRLNRAVGRFATRPNQTNSQTAKPTGEASANADKSRSESDDATTEVPFQFKEVKLNAEAYGDPALQTLGDNVNGMYKHFSGHHQRVSKQIEDLTKHLSTVANILRMQEFDRRVSSLGEDFHELLGQGATGGQKQGSDAWNNRDKLMRHYQQICAAQGMPGREPISDDELFDMAVASAFPKHRENIASKKTTDQIRNRRGQFVAGGARQKEPETKSGDAKAAAAAASKMRSLGMLDV